MRNQFGAIETTPDFAVQLINEAEKVGVFTRGIASDRKQRGSSINVDCYGYDQEQGLVIIQVRQCMFNKHKGYFNKVRKDYYLIGHTESGNIFAHPVPSPARSRRALESPERTVRWVLAKIWSCEENELDDIVRQGDVAFIPARLPASAQPVLDENGQPIKEITIRETHKIIALHQGSILKSGDTYYVARAAKAVHTKRQHDTVRVKNGFYRVQAGIRESIWGFTAPKGD